MQRECSAKNVLEGGDAIERSNEISFETYFGGLLTWSYKCLGFKNIMGLLHYLLLLHCRHVKHT